MKYWVYINDKVDGPYDETNLVTLDGFTPNTLICSEEVASNGGQEWVKASSIFEFDEVPVNEPVTQPAPQQPSAPTPVQPNNDSNTQALLAQLAALTSGMAGLQSKLDFMQQNLDNALEQNKKLSDKVAQLSQPAVQESVPAMSSEEPYSNTITLTQHDTSSLKQEEIPAEESSFPQQATPEEEEVVIRSALDSIYGDKPVQVDDTFQDLLPEKTAEQEARKKAEDEKAARTIENELEFTPIQEEATPADQSSEELSSPALVAQASSTHEDHAEPLPAEALDEIEKELTFMSLEEKKKSQAPQEEDTPQVEVKEAIITTPDLEEATKDALIAELTSSPKEDILDQIIAEHQQPNSPQGTSQTTQAALGAAAAGLAAASLVSLVDNTAAQEAPMTLATDKENPEKLEEVLPAEQMPEDVAAAPVEPLADLPSVEQTPEVPPQPTEQETTPQIPVDDTAATFSQPQEEPEPVAPEIPVAESSEQDLEQPAETQAVAQADLPTLETQPAPSQQPVSAQPAEETTPSAEQTVQELVPGAKLESPKSAEPEGFYLKEETPNTQEVTPVAEEQTPVAPQTTPSAEQETSAAPEVSSQEEAVRAPGAITDKDLQDAFGDDDTQPNVTAATVSIPSDISSQPEGNPNELTEIQLKEGSTYLISDFVPPAQVTDDVSEIMNTQRTESSENKKQETAFQDMLAAVTMSQSTKALKTDGLPVDLAATQVNLENTIQAKRGASMDIKTVPMVPEPAETERLDVNELNDVNSQHGVKRSGGLAKSTKIVLSAGILLLLFVLYAALGLMKLLPASVNLFAGKQQTSSAQSAQELLPQAQPPLEQQGPTPAEQAQEKVQNFPLPNGLSLKAFIESKHPAISPELITWETTDAVEADNYSVTVKVPPENPQNFKTVYRFNYNTLSGLLDPTVSDAKNLLDQAYGIQPTVTEPVATTEQPPQAASAKKTTRNTSRKGSARKRAS